MDRDLKVDRSRDATGHCLRQGDRRKEAGRERAQNIQRGQVWLSQDRARVPRDRGGGSTKRRTGKV